MGAVPRVLGLLLLLPLIAACSNVPAANANPVGTGTGDPCAPWGCAQLARLDTAAAAVGRTPGHLSITVTDRQTGAVWHGGEASLRTWAGSTPKLALTVYLLEEARAGQIKLSSQDQKNIDAMLSVSDNDAADALWDNYANSTTVMQRWQTTYGMTGASYVDGWPKRWGFVKLGNGDLTALMTYILTKLNATDRQSIVDRMRTVGDVQHWGVWAAGAAQHPGVKDGWDYCVEKGDSVYRWVTATVGFVGPDERYIVAAQYDGQSKDPLDTGVHALSDVIATVFGAAVPATVVVPKDY